MDLITNPLSFLTHVDSFVCCRNAGKPAPDYRIQQSSAYPVEYTSRSRITRINRSGSYSRAVMESNGWNPSKGLASHDAAEAASDAAEALISEIENKGGHAYAKIMTSSQVSSGFWANAPRGVERHVTFIEKTPISLKLPQQENDPADALYQRDDGTWNCIWLPRKAGAGFSGGWRGFAIDLDLFPGDVCVFEIDESSKPGGGRGSADVLIVHIFRAFDYDTETVREQRKKQAAVDALKDAEEDDEDDEDDELEFEKDESSDDDEEEEEEDGAMIEMKNLSPSSKKARAQLVKKRQRQVPGMSTATKKARVGKNRNQEKKQKAVLKPRATGNFRKQTTRTSTATADSKKSAKGSSKISAKRHTKTAHRPVLPLASARDLEENTDTDKDGEKEEEEEEEEFFVEKIEGLRTESDGTKRYFVKWYGYPRTDNTWEPLEMFNAPPQSYPVAAGVRL